VSSGDDGGAGAKPDRLDPSDRRRSFLRGCARTRGLLRFGWGA
jgi:hypothetical protein